MLRLKLITGQLCEKQPRYLPKTKNLKNVVQQTKQLTKTRQFHTLLVISFR